MNDYVKRRWFEFCNRMGAQGPVEEYWRKIEAAYSEEGRDYHSLNHLETMLRAFDATRDLHLSKEMNATELCIFTHDYVMKKLSHTNEAESFEFTKQLMLDLKFPFYTLKMPSEILIDATKHDYYRIGEPMCWLLLDLDLLSLGHPWEEYLVTESNVRKEYEWVPQEIYEEQRVSKFIIPFLNRPSIFMTEHFKSHYEDQARSNLLKKWGPQIEKLGGFHGTLHQ